MDKQPLNISSLVIKVEPARLEETLALLRASGLCEVHFHDASGKIIVTIEGGSAGDEVRKMKAIQGLPHILSADLAYSYCEDELDQARKGFIESGAGVPERLRQC